MKMLERFLKEEDALGTVEIILILVVLIGIVIVFKTEIETLVNDIFTSINTKAGKII